MISDEAENHEAKNPQPQGGVSIESERIETSPIESTVSVLDDGLKIFEASLEKSVVNPSKSINNISPFDAKLENPSEITVGLEERSLEDFDLRKFNYEGWLRDRYQDPARCRKSNIGVSYQNLNAYGFETYADYQKTFWNYPISYFGALRQFFGQSRKIRTDILRDFEGLVKSGELLMVLGRPGSGCTTLLKTLAGRTHGFFVDSRSLLNYQGIPSDIMHSEFRGECNYQAESDVHFPHLTVSQTLSVAAEARVPANAVTDSSRKSYVNDTVCATAAALGLSHTLNVKIGNDYVRGISGGERQRVSIAEVLACDTSLQSWDNSTRGLDSANALNFVKVLRASSKTTGSTHIVSMYQASQDMYDVFDKVVLLYEGRQIFFGRADVAKTYFTNLGFLCPEHTATCDFLTSLTNPSERVHLVREGFELGAPRTADEFAQSWKTSAERAELLEQIKQYNEEFPLGQEKLSSMRHAQKSYKTKGQRSRSPYILPYRDQVWLCAKRGYQRLVNDLTPPISGIVGNAIISTILGSIFYNMLDDTSSFFGRGALIFFTVLTNSFLGSFEGVQLWDQRPIVEKHFQYALYHPSAEAIASLLCDIPNKLLLTTFFNVPFYFLSNMRRTPSAFFTFYLFAFATLITGSMLFRTIGAMSRTLTESIAPGANFILMLMIYTGFVLPVPSMHPWFRWFAYIDPVAYAFESLMINEFSGRQFSCTNFVPEGPGYENIDPSGRICSTVGAVPGSTTVGGDVYLASSFQYRPQHLWRNLGIILGMMVFLCGMYLVATECISARRSKGEILIFRRGHLPGQKPSDDEESHDLRERHAPQKTAKGEKSQSETTLMTPRTEAATFLWDKICYDVKVQGGTKRVLDDVEGWIRPGTLTALMGASGAGKTSLLNVLANRATTGMISGEKIVDFKYQDEGFARKVGYVQQQDLHLSTSTVREALIFSARLRQSKSYSDGEKIKFVDHLIDTLDMSSFAEAVIGIPGEGLNVEQRKRVTIGVELAARPELLLFLDEPTSGLDSNTAWSICTTLRKLAKEGQDILCTIHQPSGHLFEMFDRLLFLVEGKSVYFGELGPGCRTLVDYFERRGARKCGADENPAEWLLDITGDPEIHWAEEWRSSEERQRIKNELEVIKGHLSSSPETVEKASTSEFAASFIYQLYTVTKRNFENDWRSPSELYSKILLTLGAGLVNGFSFYNSPNSLQGIQNQVFSTFLLLSLHSNLVQIIMPNFIKNRSLYEVRERPSRTYSWVVFVMSNVIAEIPWQTCLSVVTFVTWYYPLGMYKSAEATNQLGERGFLMFLASWSFLLFSSTFSQMLGTIMPEAATGINISALLYSLSLIFCGVLVPPDALPRFWLFMYRSTPVTYLLSTMVSTGLAGVPIECGANELLNINPPAGQTCKDYLTEYMDSVGGTLLNPEALQQCQFCPVTDTDTLLAALNIYFSERWRDFGISMAYVGINVAGALLLYWLFRVPKNPRLQRAK